jgi:hypothetical protein
MEREEAYEAEQPPAETESSRLMTTDTQRAVEALKEQSAQLRYSYRHGDKSAEVLSAELLDSSRRSADLVETGAQLLARVRVLFHRDVDEPVFGFLIRNRHGIHAYGANTEQKEVQAGRVRRGEIIEVSFAFDCWLGSDFYNVSFAVHSADGISYDWLDGVLFFRVVASTQVEGIANLNASAALRRLGQMADSQNTTDKELSLP